MLCKVASYNDKATAFKSREAHPSATEHHYVENITSIQRVLVSPLVSNAGTDSDFVLCSAIDLYNCQ